MLLPYIITRLNYVGVDPIAGQVPIGGLYGNPPRILAPILPKVAVREC